MLKALADPEGSLWQDPPNYWENIVWPAYLRAHAPIFDNGDAEDGQSNGTVPELFVLEGENTGMTVLFERACQEIVSKLGLENNTQ